MYITSVFFYSTPRHIWLTGHCSKGTSKPTLTSVEGMSFIPADRHEIKVKRPRSD